MELILREGLIRVRPELLCKVWQCLVGPVVQRIAGVLVAVRSRPLIPQARAEDAEARHLAQRRRLAILAIAVVLVHTAWDGSNTALGHRHVAWFDSQAVV